MPQNKSYEEFYFSAEPVTQNDAILHYSVEGDWSNAAFLLVGGAVAGNIILKGMDLNSVQGDKAVLEVLKKANAAMQLADDEIKISNSDLVGFTFDATDCPDLFPPLVALASHCKGISKIRGVHRLAHKESDRAATLQQEFSKLNISVTFEDDEMIIKGGNGLQSAAVSSHNDHRIAMATAVAGLKGNSEMIISGAEAVNKSYPQFWADMKTLGANISLNDN